MIATTIIGKSVVTGLTSETQNRFDDTDILQYPIGIASTAANYYQTVAKQLDQETLNTLQTNIDLINEKKSQIVALSELALGPFIPGFNNPVCALASEKTDVNTNIDSERDVIPAATGIGGTTTPQVAYGVVRSDYIRIQRYPYLENREAPNDNALEGLKFPILRAGNAGQGKQNAFFKNAKWNDEYVTYFVNDDDGSWSTEGWSGGDTLGNYYQITGGGSGFILIYGEVNADRITFSPNDAYIPYLSQFVGIQTGIWNPEGPNAPVAVAWNPVTTQIYSIEILPPKNPNQPPTLSPVYEGPGVLSIATTSSCANILSQINTLEAEITTLRVGINTYFDGSNSIKRRKHSQQLRIWSYERIKIRNSEEQVAITTAITATEEVDPNIPLYPEYAIDSTKFTIDSDIITIDIN